MKDVKKKVQLSTTEPQKQNQDFLIKIFKWGFGKIDFPGVRFTEEYQKGMKMKINFGWLIQV